MAHTTIYVSSTHRTAGGLRGCVSILEDSLLAVSLDLETASFGGAGGGGKAHVNINRSKKDGGKIDGWDVHEACEEDTGIFVWGLALLVYAACVYGALSYQCMRHVCMGP